MLLKNDYTGIIVTMIHKFRDMPADLNLRKNIYVLIDEAHRTTGGDLGNFLMAGLPNASYIGFTGTPVDKTVLRSTRLEGRRGGVARAGDVCGVFGRGGFGGGDGDSGGVV